MPLDPQVQALLESMAASGAPPLHTLPVPAARGAMYTFLPLAGPPEEVASVEDRQIEGAHGAIPVRIYTPEGSGPFPVLVFFHGGGFIIGDIATYDPLCRKLTNAAHCITVSVDYHLAPEEKFPAAVDDAYAATCWVAKECATFHGDPTRIAVAGDSAGGNLAAVVSLMARDQGGPSLVYQVLIYPVTDARGQAPSITENGDGYLLTKETMLWFTQHYLHNDDEKLNPLASPLLASDLSNLPPALVITAEFDPLRDEGEIYADRLKAAGVPITVTRYNGMIHLFLSMAGVVDQGKEAFAQIARELRKAFSS